MINPLAPPPNQKAPKAPSGFGIFPDFRGNKLAWYCFMDTGDRTVMGQRQRTWFFMAQKAA